MAAKQEDQGRAPKPKAERPTATDQQASEAEERAATMKGSEGLGGQRGDIGSVHEQFLISAAPGTQAWFQPMNIDILADHLAGPGIEIVKRVSPSGVVAVQGAGMPAAQTVIVARMTHEKARAVNVASGGQLTIEVDAPLHPAELPRSGDGPAWVDPAVIVPLDTSFAVEIEVRGEGNPLAAAEIYLFGRSLPVGGLTDGNGRVRLALLNDDQHSIRGMVVKPKGGFWNRWITRPQLDPNSVNTVEVNPLSTLLPNFPKSEALGWGQRAMRVDQIPPSFRGRGVRVAVIDSGAAAGTHRNLTTIRRGFDVVHESSSGWDQDTIGHGSHCAGIIGGADDEGVGIRGFAPEAEVHILKIFPGGRLSDLIGALDYCMQNDIDVVSPGVVSEQFSEIVEQRLQKAASLGIACIAPAGNSSGPVLYPARSANVLAVSAIGKGGEFPSDSYHARLPVGLGQPNGFFFPRFSCYGPEVAVAGPGVAIVSAIPPNDFSARDGTSVAAAHIVGLAALVLAHNPDFETAFGQRNAARVGHLFDVLKQSAQPLNLGDRQLTGAGLPDAVMALQSRAMVAGWAGTLTQDQQAEIGRRVAEAVRHAVQSATFQPAGWAAKVGPGQYSPGPSHPGLAAAWPPSPRH